MSASPANTLLRVNPKARRISVRVDPSRRAAILTIPRARDAAAGRDFARQREAWITRALAELPPPLPFCEGAMIPVRGEERLLTRSRERGSPRLLDGPPPTLDVPALPETFPGRVKRALIAVALEELTRLARSHAAALGAPITGVTVKDTRTRWGSCAIDGRLSFSWRLICAPPDVIDYVAAHEAAHLIERNHGPGFWTLVDGLVGDAASARAWLRDHGASLYAIGAQR